MQSGFNIENWAVLLGMMIGPLLILPGTRTKWHAATRVGGLLGITTAARHGDCQWRERLSAEMITFVLTGLYAAEAVWRLALFYASHGPGESRPSEQFRFPPPATVVKRHPEAGL